MLKLNKQALGRITRSRTALAIFAATVLTGDGVSEASARPDRHHGHHHHHHFHDAALTGNGGRSWRDTNAAIAPSSGSGQTFSGMASFYGNESGSKTASGASSPSGSALTAGPCPRGCSCSPPPG